MGLMEWEENGKRTESDDIAGGALAEEWQDDILWNEIPQEM